MGTMTNYEVWQIPHPEEGDAAAMEAYIRYAFEGLDRIDSVKLSLYKRVYDGTTEMANSDIETLEKLFVELNFLHPADYHARSLSVSDIVNLAGRYYFCDDFGWMQLQLTAPNKLEPITEEKDSENEKNSK